MPLRTGERLGAYEITGPLGKGGMGEVYRGRDTKLDREVAVKVLPEALARDPERLIRFEREAKALAALNHPNIAQIYAVEGTAMVMELVRGETLGDRIKRGAIPVDEALNIAAQMASALDAAHEKGIIHRDFKPGNVMVTPEGVVKVLDFGLVGRAPSAPNGTISVDPEDSPTLTMAATQAGFIMGTAAYMAPEQASGKTVDKRADIWSFGVVLWEMLTGKRAFEGETVSHVLAAVLTKELDLSVIPVRVRPLLARCLEKDPRKRLRDIGDAMGLVAAMGSLDPVDTGLQARQPAPSWVWALAIGATLAAGFAFLAFRPKAEAVPRITRFEIHAPAGATLPLGTPAVSPDGRTIVYVVADKDGTTRLYARALDSIEARVLAGTEGAIHPFFSPDGQSVGYGATGQIKRVDLSGGEPRALVTTGGPWQGTWSRDGVILTNAWQGPAAGGKYEPVLLNHPYFLPDGHRYLVFVEDKIELGTLGSKERRPVLDNAESAGSIAATPGGTTYLFFARGGSVMAQPFDEAAGKLTGEPTRILDDVGRVANPALALSLGVSGSGTLAYQRNRETNEADRLSWWDRSGKPQGSLPPSAFGSGPVLSPDGRFAAVLRPQPTGARTLDVWVLDLQRGAATRLTFDKSFHSSLAWTPDGKMVSYFSSADSGGILMKDALGQGEEILLKKAEPRRADGRSGTNRLIDWSPDGKFVLLQRFAGPAELVAVVNGKLDLGKKAFTVGSVNGANTEQRFSPDGKYLSYSSTESGRQEVYVERTPPGTGRWQISVTGGNRAVWRGDGKELYFRGNSNGGLTMMAVDVNTGASSFTFGTLRPLFNMESSSGYDVSKDGKQFLYAGSAVRTDSPIIVVQNWWAALKK